MEKKTGFQWEDLVLDQYIFIESNKYLDIECNNIFQIKSMSSAFIHERSLPDIKNNKTGQNSMRELFFLAVNSAAKDNDPCEKRNMPGPGFLTGPGSGPWHKEQQPSQDSSLTEQKRQNAGQDIKEEGAA